MQIKKELPFFYSGLDINKFKFYAVPQLLFDSEDFDNISLDSKVLYSIMLDKTLLSHKNSERFSDENNKVYIIYKNEDITEDLQKGHSTVSKLLSELENAGLIERVRSNSFIRTNRIYVKNFIDYSKQINDSYLYADIDFDKYLFYMLPKELITNITYKKLSLSSKVLYMFMLERVKLSKMNQEKYSDKDGRIFIFYSIDNIQERMRCSRATAVKLLKELEKFGLVEKIQAEGFNTANKLYVLDFAANKKVEITSKPAESVEISRHPNFELPNVQNLNSPTSKKQTTEHPEIELLNIQNLNPNNTYNNNTYKSYSHQSDRGADRYDDDGFEDSFFSAIELSALAEVNEELIVEYVSDEVKQGLSASKYNARFRELKQKALDDAVITESLAMSVVRYIQTADENLYISGRHITKSKLKDILLHMNSVTFSMAKDKLLSVKTPIRNYGAYMVSVLLDLSETEKLHVQNVINSLDL